MLKYWRFPSGEEWDLYVWYNKWKSRRNLRLTNAFMIIVFYIFLVHLVNGNPDDDVTFIDTRYREAAPYLFVLCPFIFYYIMVADVRKVARLFQK